ncbi:MAG TPA: DPP IV N-terminal domain-containing protein [Phycisphaerae bacterium]|nr:DPP IV N-terminal domain-containing protein [Phycisphaerae bacterium]
MTKRPLRRTFLFLLNAALINTACAIQPQQAAQPVVADPAGGDAPTSRTPAAPNQFSQDVFQQEIIFEGQPASNLTQHTPRSEGADLDPSLDRSGRIMIFASTRHSRFSHLYIKAVDGSACTQITDESANDAQPVFSPDGKRIAFASDRGGQWDIWVAQSDGRNPQQLTSTPWPELHPSWSPDGKRLVYCRVNPREGRGELWTCPLENPGEKRFVGEGLFPSWSPTGDKIAYQRARLRGSRWFSIWTLKLESNNALFPTEIAADPDKAFIAPAWSADGRQIAFVAIQFDTNSDNSSKNTPSSAPKRSEIGVVDADGGGLMLLTNGEGENYSPHWAIDGRIYFTSRTDNAENIWSLQPLDAAIAAEPAWRAIDHRAARVNSTDEP